jgi:hypothetical protein
LAAVVIAQDTYALNTAHHLTWRAIVGSVLVLTFVVLHIRQSRWTWIVLMVLAIITLAEVPLVFASAHASPPSVRLFSVALAAAIGIFALIYSLVIRKRFGNGTRTI